MSTVNRATGSGALMVEAGSANPMYFLQPNGVNRTYFGRAASSAPPSTYADGTAPVAGDQWFTLDTSNNYYRQWVCTNATGPVWTPMGVHYKQSPGNITGAVTPDFTAGSFLAYGTMTGNVTMNAPTGIQQGATYVMFLQQDGTGGRTIAWNAAYNTNWQPPQGPSQASAITFLAVNSSALIPQGAWPPAPLVVASQTGVTVAASTTAAQNLMSFAFPTAVLNGVGRSLRFAAAGIISTQATQPAIQFTLKLNSNTSIVLPSAASAPGAQLASKPWRFEGLIYITTAGASGAFVAELAGVLPLGTTTAPASNSYGNEILVVSGFDTTAALTVQVTVTFSTNASTSNSCTQRLLAIEAFGSP